jgi:hypothetical protein
MSESLPNGPATPVVDLATDLRALVGIRSRTSIRDRWFPALDQMTGCGDDTDRERRYAARQDLVDRAIAVMTDDAHRQAAEILLSVGRLRWQPLTLRGGSAAAVFGLGWDGYRRKRESTGTSLLEETLAELAAGLRSIAVADDRAVAPSVLADLPPETVAIERDTEGDERPQPSGTTPTAPQHRAVRSDSDHNEIDAEHVSAPVGPNDPGARRTTDLTEGQPDSASALDGVPEAAPADEAGTPDEPDAFDRPTRRRIVRLAVLGIVVGVVAATVLFLAARNNHRPSAQPPAGSPERCGTMTSTIGGGGSAPALDPWRQPFRDAARDLGDRAACASSMELKAITADGTTYVFQTFTDQVGGAISALVSTTAGPTAGPKAVVLLDPIEWLQVRDDHVENPATMLGRPVTRVDHADGQRDVVFTNGMLYRESDAAPAWTITGAFYRHWQELGGLTGSLGRPLAEAIDGPLDTGRVQSFSKARLVRGYQADAVFEVVPYSDEDRQLGDVAGLVVDTEGNASWWVDTRGARHWIGTTCAYDRLRSTTDRVDRTAISLANLKIGTEITGC